MKRILFNSTFLFTYPFFFLFGLVGELCLAVANWFNVWENWCLEYDKPPPYTEHTTLQG